MSLFQSNLSNMDICALILCAGTGTRSGLAYNKLLHTVGTKTVLERTLDAFAKSDCTRFVITAAPGDEAKIKELASPYENVQVVLGGATRAESVLSGLRAIQNCDIVVIHDGARCFVSKKIIDESVLSAVEYGSGIAAVRTVDTIKGAAGSLILRHLDRTELVNVQTPQSFRYREICDAYEACDLSKATDDSEVYADAGYFPRLTRGSYENTKVTHPSDFFGLGGGLKVGTGFDVHELVEGRKLILGGVEVPYHLGLKGHSDADVLTHAIMDALLSAAGLRDIGTYFPDTDGKYLNANSISLLKEVNNILKESGFKPVNISAVVMAQKPRLSPFIPAMQENLAAALGLTVKVVGVAATTTETLGIVGEGKGIAASASVLIMADDN